MKPALVLDSLPEAVRSHEAAYQHARAAEPSFARYRTALALLDALAPKSPLPPDEHPWNASAARLPIVGDASEELLLAQLSGTLPRRKVAVARTALERQARWSPVTRLTVRPVRG